MFLKKSTKSYKGKSYSTYTLTESYREEGKIKHRNIHTLGPLTDEQAQQIRLVLQVGQKPSVFVADEEDLLVANSLAYLDVMALHHLWQQWHLHQFFTTDRWAEALVINRCLDPVSKINLRDWAKSTVLPAVIPALHTYDEYDVYRELDRLSKQEEALQLFLYEQLKRRKKMSTDAFFYDITSSYFEGSQCVLAALGYSRDHRPDKEQVVIALMITPEGYPFYWQVLEGNTQDVTTIQALVSQVKARFGITTCTLVFDRGMVSAGNLSTIEQHALNYVSAMDAREIRARLLDQVIPQAATPDDWEQMVAMHEFQPVGGSDSLFYRELQLAGQRYVLTFDVACFLDQQQQRKRRIQAVEEGIHRLNQGLAAAKRPRKQTVAVREAERLLARNGFKKQAQATAEPLLLEVPTPEGATHTVSSFTLKLTWFTEKLRDAARLDGLTAFITNLPPDKMPVEEVISWYRRKNKVEEAFHELKSHLQLRPMHVTREQRVRAHVSICMLANFLLNDMEQLLQAAGHSLSPQSVLEGMEACQAHQLEVKPLSRKILKVQEETAQQREWLQALNAEILVQGPFKKKLLKQLEKAL